MAKTSITKSMLALGLLVTWPMLGCGGADDSSRDDAGSIPTSEQPLALAAIPPLPSPTLAVPEGNSLAFYFDAVGVQIYACQASPAGYAWTFVAPEASLFNRRGRVVIKHYAGPTWEYTDGSKVVGTKIAGFTADPSAIPELLLQAASHDGVGRLSDVTYIQRLETTGGLAPAEGCDADHLGEVARIDYTATYFFYRANGCAK